MKHTKPPVIFALSLISLLLSLSLQPARADEYSDVSQLVRAGKLSEALSRADQFLATQARDPQMRFIKGVIQRDSGKTAEAIATFTRLTEDYPELPEPYNNLAVLYAGQSQFDKARSALEMAIRTNPSYATAHENLGDIYAKLASQAYNKALQLDNANPAVPPKLALIREIFSTPKAQRPASPASSAPGQVLAQLNPPAKPQPVPTPAAPTPVPATPTPPPKAVIAAPVAPPVVAAPVLAPQATPAAGNNTPPAQATDSAASKEVENAVAKWASAWSARDVKAYLAMYGKDFVPPGGMSRSTWERERQQRIAGKASISVKIDNLAISVNGSHAQAKFRQDYKAGGLAVASGKTLDFAKVGEHWSIVKETVGR